MAAEKKPSFKLPEIVDNPHGWGPSGGVEKFAGLPYEPFSKGEMLGRISDWNQPQFFQQRGFGFGGQPAVSAAIPLPRAAEEDDSAFSLVDTKPKLKPKGFRRNFRQRWTGAGGQNNQQRGGMRGRGGRGNTRGSFSGGRGGFQQRGGRNDRMPRKRWQANPWQQQHIKDVSLTVKQDWKLIEETDFATLSKATAEVTIPDDLVQAGTLEAFNPKFDQVSSTNPVNLQRFETRQFFTTTASDDPVILRLTEQKAGNVFVTDTVLSVLMAATRSVQQWDVIVRKEGNTLFFDKRPTSRIDFWTVNENWSENLPIEHNSPNHPYNLSVEATLINHNFSQQVLLKEGAVELPEPNPFADAVDQGNQAASIGYRYRKWDLGDDIEVVARCELNAVSKQKTGETMNVTVKALNEFDPKLSGGVDWRRTLATQPGAVLATEMKNNSNKLARWTAQSIISGAEQMILGFVSRVHPKDQAHHVVIKTQRFKPRQFGAQIKFNERNAWGIIKMFVQKIRKLEDGTYLLFKDNNKPSVQLFSIPADAVDFEDGTEAAEEPAPAAAKPMRPRPFAEEEYEEEPLDA